MINNDEGEGDTLVKNKKHPVLAGFPWYPSTILKVHFSADQFTFNLFGLFNQSDISILFIVCLPLTTVENYSRFLPKIYREFEFHD